MTERVQQLHLTVIVDNETLADMPCLPDTGHRLYHHLRDIHLHTTRSAYISIGTQNAGLLALFNTDNGRIITDWAAA